MINNGLYFILANNGGMNGFHSYVKLLTWPYVTMWLMSGVNKRRFKMGRATNPQRDRNPIYRYAETDFTSLSLGDAVKANII